MTAVLLCWIRNLNLEEGEVAEEVEEDQVEVEVEVPLLDWVVSLQGGCQN